MAKLADMTKHRGFPYAMPGTGIQFVIRRANPKGQRRSRRCLAMPGRDLGPTASMRPSSTLSGIISVRNRSSAAISMPPG